uniref:DUF6875 domain-containing protein n=1 Tax=Herbidospora sakaeratensis TaxID=564415 RepID=UPI000785AAC2|nr:hypothetical protein [Herbidospora sakaeratensis]
MITHPDEPTLRLFDVKDVESGRPLHPLGAMYIRQLRTVTAWAREYLCRPHPELGRRGPVCPYAQGSIDRGRFLLAIRPGRPKTVEEVVAAVEPYRQWFGELAPRSIEADSPARATVGLRPPASRLIADSMHTAVLVLFPDAGRRLDLIDGAQEILKDRHVPAGVMVGEFHDGPPDKGGLWNPLLRPLEAPVPMLVVRHMVSTDLPFLTSRDQHVSAYRAIFGDRIPAHLRDVVPS